MPNVRLQRVIKVGDSLAITLPVAVCRTLGIERGDQVTLGIFESNTIVVRRLTDADLKQLRPQQITYDE